MKTLHELEERLSRPRPELITDMSKIMGDILVLGAAGKLGPSLVRLALRAIAEVGSNSRVIAVSRFGDQETAAALRDAGAVVIAADITDDDQLDALPDADNVIFLVGAKFGTAGNEDGTWATNTYLPGQVAKRYRNSRIVALSTGNVYPFTPAMSVGPAEQSPLHPVGDYAMSCVGRERVLTHFSKTNGTSMVLVRLNYAVEMRYGVLVDVARKVQGGEPVDVTTGHANVIWQGYANEVIIRALLYASTPPFLLNLTGLETESIRDIANQFGQLLEKNVAVIGEEANTALLSDASACHEYFGDPDLSVEELMEHTAEWISEGGPLLDKPTGFQTRDGKF